MKAYSVSLINAAILIVLAAWGYLSSDTPSITALIPATIGVLLILCNNGVKKENKVIAHIAVMLTLVILIGLIKPLTGAIGRNDMPAIFRVIAMLLSTAIALLYFIKSFRDARKNREKTAKTEAK